MAQPVKDVDRGWRKLLARLSRVEKGKSVSVGIQGDKAQTATEEHGGMTNVGIGVLNEFGAPKLRIPARSHWRSTFDENQNDYLKEIQRIAANVYNPESGDSLEGDLKLLGEKYRFDVIKKIDSSIAPELSAVTLARRQGETIPLRVTGQYIGSFDSVIVDPEEKRQVQ